MEWDENTSAMFGVSTEGHRPGIAEIKNLNDKTSIDVLAIEVEALAVKVTTLAARIAERDLQLARLRREMDTLRLDMANKVDTADAVYVRREKP